MPKSKQKGQKQREDDVSDDDTMAQATQMTQAEKVVGALSDNDVQQKVNDLVGYLLIMHQKKYPIKRQDINKVVLKEQSRGFNAFMVKAKAKLHEVFGIELVELDSKQKSYILINELETEIDDPHLSWPPEDNATMGLLIIVLSVIFMSGNTIEEDKLFHTLKKLGVDVEHPHEVFGDVKRFLTQELVKQGYLQYTRVDLSDPPAFNFTWGPRAKAETSQKHVLDFVCQVYGDKDPTDWTSQWQDVLRSEDMESVSG